MEDDTASLRSAAPNWTLAGDKQLLDILQNIHQSLMTRCQEVNARLDEMVTALDGASVDLQNVNNKFMALSNSQFIESRVYDDDVVDVDVSKQEAPKEAPPPTSPPSELTDILEGVRTLQRCHDTVRICGDSDSSDSEEEISSVVLRPKDMYSHRPLPLIIGTAAWRNKWHAGLIAEDSDSDSSTSKPEVPEEEYSESEPEGPELFTREGNDLTETDCQGSTTSSEVFSEQDILPVKPSPSDVAAELARKLRGPAPIPEEDTQFVPPQPTTKKVYRPDLPTTGTVFSDEPPPFECQSEGEPYEEEEDDIFAELHKKPYANTNKVQSSVVEDLFGGLKDDRGGLFSDFVDNEIPPPVANQKSTLFEDESESELFASKPPNKPTERRDDTNTVETVKKPIGGISLFGSNKSAESIGAAILKRNRRKSSSEEESPEETKPTPKEKPVRATEKDIFDDLFAKSEKEQKTKKNPVNKEVKTDEVDLFSDNLFDDIDDIFTTDIKPVKVNTSSDKKSIFDDAEDDLFANIAVTESVKREIKSETQNKSVFDSDDDLFSDKIKPETKVKEISVSKTNASKSNKVSKSLFDDDGSDSDIFTKLSDNKVNSLTKSAKVEINVSKTSEESKHFNINNVNINNITNNNVEAKNNVDRVKEKPPLLFDDDDNDSDADDIFNNSNINTSINNEKSTVPSVTAKENKIEIKVAKTSLFDDDDGDDLFTSSNKSSNVNEDLKNIPPVEVKSKTSNDYNIFNTTIKDSDSKEEVNDISHINNTETVFKDDIKNRNEASQNKTSIFDDDNDTLFGEIESSNSINNSITNKLIDSTPSPTNLKPDQNEIKSTKKDKKQNELNINADDKTIEPKTEKVKEKSNIPGFDNKQKEFNIIADEKTLESKTESVRENTDISNLDSSSKLTKEDNTLFNTVKEAVFNTTDDIFNDLIDEPPAFEKPKEPKKSKNINALFDDDSDDEALFFKKNDVTFDDKLDEESDSNNDPMFGIFHDEPPAIDIDFTSKSNDFIKNNLISDHDLFETPEKPDARDVDGFKQDNNHNISVDIHDELFKTSIPITSPDSNDKVTIAQDVPKSIKDIDDFLNSDSDNDLFQTLKGTEKPIVATKPIQKEVIKATLSETKSIDDRTKKAENIETLKTKLSPEDESQSSDTPDSPEIKKIGKLKTMNFNIDVSTLLPGASPKKKSTEQTDGQVISAKSQEDLHAKENVEHTIVKSVSFEGEPDSQILDNKLSKERAKIQVKRKPSTRRARKEAVRKSVLDLGEDSTDNSSSFDDAPITDQRRIKNYPKRDENKEQNSNNIETDTEQIVTIEHKDLKDTKVDVLNDKQKSSNVLENENTNNNIEPKAETNKSKINTRQDNVDNKNSETVDSKTIASETKLDKPYIIHTKEESKNVKSKIVYILNDEDIFNTPVEKEENPKSITNIEGDSIFRNPVKNDEPSISTLAHIYKEDKQETSVKKSIFDDLSDEENELFNTNKKVTPKTKGILDSDSEDELFFGKKETKDKVSKVSETKDKVSKVKETEDVKPKVKTSLFGDDDDDDDDLFGAKVKIDRAPSQPVRSSRDVIVKPSQPALQDPLSLLGADDD